MTLDDEVVIEREIALREIIGPSSSDGRGGGLWRSIAMGVQPSPSRRGFESMLGQSLIRVAIIHHGQRGSRQDLQIQPE